VLSVVDLVKDFGGLHAVDGVSFEVGKGTITGLIGPNGAGKTTTFNMVAGAFPPTRGQIRFDGKDISSLPAHKTFRAGLVRTFQIPRPFSRLTVLENLMMVPSGQLGERFWNTWFMPAAVRAEELRLRDKAVEILDFLGLTRLAEDVAGNLSGGQMKLLELGRALMSDPKMILLDEPGAGINPTLLGEIVERIAILNQRGITFLIIEHNMDLVMTLCDPIIVMAGGKLLMQGNAEQIQTDSRVLEAFLGGVVEEEDGVG
jgi:branched-chain amino acid transport system ATP-binding protein